jgi:hypothetical protein
MTDDDKPPAKLSGVHARLNPSPHEVEQAVADYKSRQDGERAKMANLKALRLAAEAKAGVKSKTKRKPAAKAKR